MNQHHQTEWEHKKWQFAVLVLAGVIVSGALFLIFARGEVMLIDLATQYANFVWCF